MIKSVAIKCLYSKKSNKTFVALFVNDVAVSFDTSNILKICPSLSYNDLYCLNEGESINLMKGDNK